jgi:acyl carrier protein
MEEKFAAAYACPSAYCVDQGSPMTERLKKVFGDVFEVAPETVTAEFSPATCSNWDSFHHVVLVTAMEKEFGIKLTMKEALTLDTFQKTHDLVAQKIGSSV